MWYAAIAGAALCAAGSAAFGMKAWLSNREVRARAKSLRAYAGIVSQQERNYLSEGMPGKVLAYIEELNWDVRGGARVRGGVGSAFGDKSQLAGGVCFGGKAGRERWRTQLDQAGMTEVNEAACAQAALRLGIGAGALGLAVGWTLSPVMGVFLGAVVAMVGLCLPRWAVAKEGGARGAALMKELPEAVEVWALGLRSGLTFERSFRLYAHYADTAFAKECQQVMEQVNLGLLTRSAAFERLSDGYASPLLRRTLSGVDQALLRGTSLTKDLEQAAEEARKAYRAQKEEVVAKAPVKMMLPIGTMILPAMLLLIMGPVILGFF